MTTAEPKWSSPTKAWLEACLRTLHEFEVKIDDTTAVVHEDAVVKAYILERLKA